MPVLTNSKWGLSQSNGTPGGVVTWSLAGPGLAGVQDIYGTFRSDITSSAQSLTSNYNVVAELRSAFAAWSDVADIDFVEVRDDGSAVGAGLAADIRIYFGQIDGVAGGTLGVAFFPFSPFDPRAGDALFDIEETDFYASRTNFRAVVIHEIGHAIGLDHVTGVTAIMNPIVGSISELQADDIQGVTQIYGAATAAAARISVGGSADLDVLSGPDQLQIRGDARDNMLSGSASREMLLGFGGSDELWGRGGGDTIRAGGGDDIVRGGGGGDRLFGLNGADDIFGGSGNDLIKGGGKDDDLFGGAGRDTIRGHAGDDIISGDAGSDVMTGNAGFDVFIFGLRHGFDRITDFRPGVDFLDYIDQPRIASLDDLTIRDVANGTVVVDPGGGRVLLIGVDSDELSNDDFLF